MELQSEFLKIQQKIRKTIIFVTHDIYEAIKMGDRIALMKEGRLVQYDTPASILYRPQDEFVEGFVGADDYSEVLTYWGTGTPPQITGTPEPATLALLLLGGLALLRYRRLS